MYTEYIGVNEIVGPLILVKGTENVKYGELVQIELDKEKRQGKVLDVSDEFALVQVFEGTSGIDLKNCKLRFLGKPMELGVSEDMLGRIFDGAGKPVDDAPDPIPDKMVDINGSPINPTARDYPSEFVQTGISTIDVLNPLVRGQKLPIFSGAGLPHSRVAAQITRQAKVLGKEEQFAVVFGALGITFEEAQFFMEDFKRTGALERTVVFMNLADDPAVERIATPRLACTAAEYLAFDKGMHVLVILIDMTSYCDALREIAAARREIPGRRGYPGYMYTDLAMLYERAGRIHGSKGSITLLPILTMPEDDKTHPVPDLTGYITEGQVMLARDLFKKGIYPPVDVLPSLSRLKDKGIGKGKTREDHADVMNQLFSCYARGREAKELAVILGEEALSEEDKLYTKFADIFEEKYVNQGEYTDRTIIESLNLGWQLLSMFSKSELKRIRSEYLDKYYAIENDKAKEDKPEKQDSGEQEPETNTE